MVHALIRLHRALSGRGILVDLRPDRRAAIPDRLFHTQLYCAVNGRQVHAGRLRAVRPLAVFVAADRALRHVVRRGLFAARSTATFNFHYYFDSPAHLERAVALYWPQTMLEISTRRRLSMLLRRHPGAEIMAITRVRLSVLAKQ